MVFAIMSQLLGRPTSVVAGEMQMVKVPDRKALTVAPPPSSTLSSSTIVEYQALAVNIKDEDLDAKLRHILECVPVRVNNTSGGSAGSGSVDFHQITVVLE